MMNNVNSPRPQTNCGLHPLIHTIGSKKHATKFGGLLLKSTQSASKTVLLSRAVTGLEYRHSMRLEDFFHLFRQGFPDEKKGLLSIPVQINCQYLLDF